MKICPTCQTRYEEEILRFCIRDGSPLVEEEAPGSTELPGTADDSEVTIVRRPSTPDTAPLGDRSEDEPSLVIPTPQGARPGQRPRRQSAYESPRPQPNIFKVIVLTVFCTVAVLAGVAGLVWSLRSDSDADADANSNINTNVDTNINTNLDMNGFNFNMNANRNINVNVNVNANANMNLNANRANTNAASNTNVNANVRANSNANARPTPAANAINAGAANRTGLRPAANSAVNRPVNRPANRPFDAANATRPRNVRQ